jgi:hypothetical protein
VSRRWPWWCALAGAASQGTDPAVVTDETLGPSGPPLPGAPAPDLRFAERRTAGIDLTVITSSSR